VGHIFREADGHLVEDAPENRSLLTETANDQANHRSKKSYTVIAPTDDEYISDLLSSGIDDVTGVHEALWYANNVYRTKSPSERLALAERAIKQLAAEGLITIHQGTQAGAEDSAPVDTDTADELLNKWSTWAIPDGPTVFYITTEAGKARYYGVNDG
jgi:hypothetical protein